MVETQGATLTLGSAGRDWPKISTKLSFGHKKAQAVTTHHARQALLLLNIIMAIGQCMDIATMI